jgi:hypothetical protein
MHSLDLDYAVGVFDAQDGVCLSLYQPTHRSHPENQQDPIRFRNLVKGLEKSLLREYEAKAANSLLEPFWNLADDSDFWNHSGDGLAVLGAAGFFRAYRLQRPVDELAVAADSFHLKPLLRILQSADRFHVLALSQKEVKLFEGNRDGIAPITFPAVVSEAIEKAGEMSRKAPHVEAAAHAPSPAAGVRGGQGIGDSEDHDCERFFRAVDRAILEHYSRRSGLPVVLAALPDNQELFRRISQNSYLSEKGIESNPGSLSIEDLRERAWLSIRPHYTTRLAGMVATFESARIKGLGDDDLGKVMKAAVAGRVATLLIESERQIPGRCDRATGNIELTELEHPDVDDLLDDLGEIVAKTGGQLVIVPKKEMPTTTGLAAIYRY